MASTPDGGDSATAIRERLNGRLGAVGRSAGRRWSSYGAGAYHRPMASGAPGTSARLRTEFGEIDIYLFDQLLRGRFDGRHRVLDAGCGAGRNLPYFLRHGFDVRAVDADAVRHSLGAAARGRAAPDVAARPAFTVGRLIPFRGRTARRTRSSAVPCCTSRVTSGSSRRCSRRCGACWRRVACFSRDWRRASASKRHLSSPTGRVRLPDGSERFVVDERTLLALDVDARWHARRPAQDHQRAEHTVHDDLGHGEVGRCVIRARRLVRSATRLRRRRRPRWLARRARRPVRDVRR